MDLKNKVVVITGSSSGIGQATAIRFAEEGAKIVVNYHINKEGGEETVQKIKNLGQEVLLVKADVSKPEDVRELFKSALDTFGTVDILINNTGISEERSFLETTPEEIRKTLDTDLVSAMLCSQAALNIMQEKGQGKILNTSSIRGAEHGGRAIVYAAAKAGLNSFTKTLAKQVAPHIQVNAVGPGFVKTRGYDKRSPEQIKEFLDGTLLKRWVTLDEIADAFIFLAKNDAMTGQILYVDAGFLSK